MVKPLCFTKDLKGGFMKLQKSLVFFLLALLVIASIALIGCGSTGSSGGGGSTKTVTGKLGYGYTKLLPGRIQSSMTLTYVNAVVAIPYNNTDFWNTGLTLNSMVTSEIDADGNFNLPLSSSVSNNWVLLLLDTTQEEKEDQVVGYVAMKVGDDGLLGLPIDTAKTDTISLGSLERTGSDAVSTVEAITNLNLSASALAEMAKNDNMLKSLKNLYINYNAAADEHLLVLPIMIYRGGDHQDILAGVPSDPGKIVSSPRLYSLHTQTNAVLFDAAEQQAGNLPVSLEAPAGQTFDLAYYESATTRETVSSISSPEFLRATDDIAVHHNFLIEAGYFIGTIPSGYWNIVNAGTPLATFDIDVANPVDEVHGWPITYIPEPRITTNESGVVTAISIDWYMNEGGTLTKVTDFTAFNQMLCGQVQVSYMYDTDVDVVENQYYSTVPTSIISFDNAWHFPWSGGGSPTLQMFTINYTINGVGYIFGWTTDSHNI
jgi:hypothetical protein